MRHKKQPDQRADTKGAPWAGFPHVVLKSEAYRALSLWARAILFELVLEFNGYNNGHIAVSQRKLSSRLGKSNFSKISDATAELIKHGFIDVAVEGKWKERRAREFRLTFVSTGKAPTGKPATNEYRDWVPEKISAEAGSAGRDLGAEAGSAGPRKTADGASAESVAKPPIDMCEAAHTGSALIIKPCVGPPNNTQIRRPKADEPNGRIPKGPSFASPSAAASVSHQAPP